LLARQILDVCASESQEDLPSSSADPADPQLTRRELLVLELLHKGRRRHDVAEHLGITVDTVHMHIRHACEKLGGSGGLYAAIEAHRRHLLPQSEQNTSEMV